MQYRLILKPEREKSVLNKHPWIFSGSIANVLGSPQNGSVVGVYSFTGNFLAKASYSSRSKISARILTWNQDEEIDVSFFQRRIDSALLARKINANLILPTDSIRLIHGESDGLPGLIVDKYSNILVVQILTAGLEFWCDAIFDILRHIPGIDAIFERSDSDVRELEGLPSRIGSVYGETQDKSIIIRENGLEYAVDVEEGQKTGFYLDQRYNRHIVRKLAENCDVLDCFSYSGGFTINAVKGAAKSVISVDSSAEALKLLRGNLERNHLPLVNHDAVEGDVFRILRLFRDQGRSFDLIILDPPKFAHTSLLAEKASRGYKDINLLAFKLLRSHGTLVTFSCSGGISAELFQKIVTGAALDAGVDARIVKYLRQDADHPVALNFPEGAYLKGFVVNVSR